MTSTRHTGSNAGLVFQTGPAAPALFSASSVKQITLTWDAVTGADDYSVSIEAFDGSSTAAVGGAGVVSGTAAILTGLRVGFEYRMTVCSRNSAGESCLTKTATTSE